MRKILLIAGGIAVLAILVVILVAMPQWPFTRHNFQRRLEAATSSTAQIGQFRQVFFPYPGAVAEQVVLTPKSADKPAIRAEKLSITGWYWGLIGSEKHLHSLSLDGLMVDFPSVQASPDKKPQASHGQFQDIRFDEIEANNSQLKFALKDPGSEPRIFKIYKLLLKDFAPGQPLHFNSVLHIPEPPGEVQVQGLLGPLQSDFGQIALSGSFSLKDADLSKYQGIAGKVSSQGNFKGVLSSLHVEGTTDTPDFTVTSTGHALHLQTHYSALVNGTNGDINFEPVQAQLGSTKLLAQGQLAPAADKHGKELILDITSDQAQIQDLLYLFVHSKPPMQGFTRFQAKVRLPFNDAPFVERVEMTAKFGIQGSRFTNPETRQKVGTLSESARGNPNDDDPPTVLTDLLGEVKLEKATAKFSRLAFHAPGVTALLHGNYNLESEKVDLHGTMHTDVNLSKATTGFKAFMMKVIEFAKKKKKEGATVPVSITGTYDKPSFGIDAPSEQ